MISESVITCPKCGNSAAEPMPENACRVFYDCRNCGGASRAKSGRLLMQVTLAVAFSSIVGLDRTCPKMVAAITASLGSAGYQSEPFCGILGA
jgi:hypothetical protein